MAWDAYSGRARKLYIHKAAGDTGVEQLRWRIDRGRWRVVAINPGFKGTIFLKKGRNSSIAVDAEIKTVKLNKRGRSAFYVHFETLDRLGSMDIGQCRNSMTDGGAQICYENGF